jgi:hypothetical protein
VDDHEFEEVEGVVEAVSCGGPEAATERWMLEVAMGRLG